MSSQLQARLLAQSTLYQRLQSSKKRDKFKAGFTLIELLIVVVIIGVLASIALPSFLNQRDKAENAAGDSWASTNARACSSALITDDTFTPSDPPEVQQGRTQSSGSACPGTFTSVSGSTWAVSSGGEITYTAAQ